MLVCMEKNKEITRKAYAKINLALDVTGRRADGYHLLRTPMQSIDLYDTLTFTANDSGEIRINTNLNAAPKVEQNLIWRAVDLLRETYDIKEGVEIDLKKEIPIAAGLGGGSTDAACVFHAMNELFDLRMTMEKMCEIGVTLGADIPFCIYGGTMLAEGIGEILTPVPMPPDCILLIAKPQVAVSTRDVFETLDRMEIVAHPDIDAMVAALRKGDLKEICSLMGNVLAPVTKGMHPVIEDIENCMRDYGALSAMMSGSGPTVFGVFESDADAQKAYHVLKGRNTCPELFCTRMYHGKEAGRTVS